MQLHKLWIWTVYSYPYLQHKDVPKVFLGIHPLHSYTPNLRNMIYQNMQWLTEVTDVDKVQVKGPFNKWMENGARGGHVLKLVHLKSFDSLLQKFNISGITHFKQSYDIWDKFVSCNARLQNELVHILYFLKHSSVSISPLSRFEPGWVWTMKLNPGT